MALNIVFKEIYRFGTYLVSSPVPQPLPVREEDASSHFFSQDYIVPRDLARFILDRVDDKGLARVRRVNRKWYWTIENCPRLMDRLFISSCISTGKAGIEDLRLNMRHLGWFSHPLARSNYLILIAQATLKIAKVDHRFLDIAKAAAFEVEHPHDSVPLIEKVVKEEARRNIDAANATALTIRDPEVQGRVFRVIQKVKEQGQSNEEITQVVVPLAGETLVQLEPITETCKNLNDLSPEFKLLAQRDLEGAKERALTLIGRVERALGLLAIAQVDPEHDFSGVKGDVLKFNANRRLLGTVRSIVGRRTLNDDTTDILLLEIVNVEVRYHLKDAKETALMIKDPFYRVMALVIVAKAAQSRLNSSAN